LQFNTNRDAFAKADEIMTVPGGAFGTFDNPSFFKFKIIQ